MEVERHYDLYRYEDYFQPERQIRLLKVLRVSHQDDGLCTVYCKVAFWYLEQELDFPNFNAISYTWGDATEWAPILIKHEASDQMLMVSQNCETALKQAWHYDKKAWYWVDSICINQRDAREKAYQIPLMGRIYGRAEHVLACIGQHANGSQELYHFIYHFIRNNPEIVPPEPAPKDFLVPRFYSESSSQPSETIASAFKGLAALLRRSYFKRVWIFQELHLAQRVDFACGLDFVSSKEVYRLSQIREFREKGSTQSQRLQMLPTTQDLLKVAASSGTELMSFKHVLSCVNKTALECREPVDKIFGILAVVDWKDKGPIIPDYRVTDNFSLAEEILNKILDLEGNDISRRDALEMAYVIGNLLGLFDGSSARGLHKRIQRRSVPPPTIDRDMWPDLIRAYPGARPRHCNEMYLYSGYCLQHIDSNWLFEGQEFGMARVRYESPSDKSAEAGENDQIILPKATRVGDWCLFTTGREGGPVLRGLVLIVRPTPVYESTILYDVVGIGFHQLSGPGPTARLDESWTPFQVSLCVEDALFLLSAALAFRQTLGWEALVADSVTNADDVGLDQRSAVLTAGLCWKQGSSFALMGANWDSPDLPDKALVFTWGSHDVQG